MLVGDKHCRNCEASVFNHIKGKVMADACNDYKPVPCSECGVMDGHEQWCGRWE